MCRLSSIPPQVAACTQLRWLDLSFNAPLALDEDGYGASELFTSEHRIEEFGLRRNDSNPWPNADTQSMLRIAARFTPAPKIICSAAATDQSLDDATEYIAVSVK